MIHADHPHTDPGDGRTECQTCGKFVFQVTHSCKRVPVTAAAIEREARERHARQECPDCVCCNRLQCDLRNCAGGTCPCTES